MKRPLFLLPPALFLSIAACGGGGSSDSYAQYNACVQAEISARTAASKKESPQGPFSAELLATDASKVASLVRADLKSSMRASLDNARAARIAAIRCEALRPPSDERSAAFDSAGGASPSSPGANPQSGERGAKETSGTNNQVAGVDEADFIKNDNKYIYVVKGSTFRVIEAWPAETAHEIAKVTVPGQAKKLFVEGNRALVYSSMPRPSTNQGGQGSSESAGMARPGGGTGSTECTYGYSGCVPSGDGTETEISIYDLTNRASPQLVRSVHTTSSLIAARRIGNAVHTVVAQPSIAAGVGWDSYPTNLSGNASEQEIDAAYDALIASNEGKLDRIDVGDVLPKWSDSTGGSPNLALYQSGMPDGTALTSVVSVDITNPGLDVATVISRSGWIYASASALYMAVPHQQQSGWGWYEGRSETELSTIHKFAIGAAPNATRYVGSGAVKGRVLNQFAMDENEGFLRVATTTNHAPSPDAHSTISVVEDRGGKLEIAGQIDQIAKTEDIRSVRFDGSRGYIVTFKKTDPLFVFDLADPRAPRTMGELKIPGFSTYMHMMDASHLLTIGYDAADKGDFAYFTGVLLQIFDVSNPSDPKLTHKETIGTRGSSSEALTNHLAFNYFAPKNLLALPMTICEGGDGNGTYGTQMTFSGLLVYDAKTETGFALRGRVAHPNSNANGSQNDYGYYDNGCSNWWTNASSEVKRSIIMDDWVFSVSETRIKVNNLASLSTDTRVLALE